MPYGKPLLVQVDMSTAAACCSTGGSGSCGAPPAPCHPLLGDLFCKFLP